MNSTVFVRRVVSTTALALSLVACQQQQEKPVEITTLKPYKDEVKNFAIQYPSDWQQRVIKGSQANFYSSEAVVERFVQYDTKGTGGAQVSISVVKMEGTLQDVIEKNKGVFEATAYSAPEQTTISGTPGFVVKYGFDLTDGKFQGERYFATKDDKTVTIITFESFGGQFDRLHPKFEEMLKSVELGYEKTAEQVAANTAKQEPVEFKPSEKLIGYKGTGYTLQIPDNFTARPGKKASNVLNSVKIEALEGRLDCTMQIDIIDASKQKDLNKIVDQNKAAYQNNAGSGTSLGSEKAMMINYAPTATVAGRVVFAVKGDKLYRVTLNWDKGTQAVYLPVFEKALQTFKFE